ncbi:hypothetical protein ACK3TF_006263 [Chlorella vulgaris]
MQLEQQRFTDTLVIEDFGWYALEAAVIVCDKIADAEDVPDIWTQLDERQREAAAHRLGIEWNLLQELLVSRCTERDALAHPDLDVMAEQWREARPAFVRQRPNDVENYDKLLCAIGVAVPDSSNTNV